ncbi:hypothetical protein SAMN02745121_03251 [Nannocystis exedens]|uniref:Uncharacterized protein n=1 Tax=Nannocystis exedens TaxID=54 RepID=A0A1I1YDT3_9BACT|nr:DUF6600 domain-containing protein [Nannocystis exedens]PCC71901.1 hypothetical protein NAEX_04980 [Nannocystis exedens]SFE16070.1 hypothetical protein SAMN02745121_03251 [Nannocystis exedens]
MRAVYHLAAAAALLAVGLDCHRTDTAAPVPQLAPTGPSARFYGALAPYGTWIDDAAYGWVWLPSPAIVGADFFPYMTGGRWVYTDAGWMFDSSYSWGWAPFHYGRWAFDAGVGWMWVPDDVWGPAWVDWRWNAGYVGWAPLPPRIVAAREEPRSHWIVVAARDLTRPQLAGYIQPNELGRVVFADDAAHPATHPGWRSGPPADVVAAATGQPLAPVHLPPPPRGGELVRSRVAGDAVEHTPFVESKQAPAASIFPHNPPEFPVHTMRAHTTHAPVFDLPHGGGDHPRSSHGGGRRR